MIGRFAAVGAVLFGAVAASPGSEPLSFYREVAPILQTHCQECHRPGQVAPFSLLTFDQARKRAGDLATVTNSRQMPPWHASTVEGGPFKDPRILSEKEIATIAGWVEAGCPEGDAKDAPPPRDFGSDWALGEPDLVIKMPEPYTLAATGRDELRIFVIPTGLTEGRWIRAVDFRPGNPKVVHHVIAAFDTGGRAKAFDEADPGPGYQSFGGFGSSKSGLPFFPSGGIGGWAPGKAPKALPDGVGRWLPAGSDLLLQVHYHRSGKVETDSTSIALYFAKGPIDKQLRGGLVSPPRPRILARPELHIPAGDANYEVKGTLTLPDDVHMTAVVPHMHWLGKDFRLVATLPDGAKRTLIQVDRWDFNWQDTYDFAEPIALPKGTKIDMLAHFDNSDKNPNNPSHPPRDVRWGEQTEDEMALGFLQMTRDAEHLGGKPPEGRTRPIGLGAGR